MAYRVITMTYTKSKITALRTVYPPIANSDVRRLKNDPEVEAMLRRSDFYMIAGRALGRLRNQNFNTEEGVLTFDFVVGDVVQGGAEIRLAELPGVRDLSDNVDFVVEFDGAGSGFRVWNGTPHAEGSSILEWFTAESLLWHRARGRPGIGGLDNLRELATYDLLYVGIAKVGDSFDRLFAKGHHARLEILASEPQRYPGARVSDEVFLFLFEADPLFITTFELDHDFTDADLDPGYDNKRIVADAEKAFVSLLKPGYNVKLFPNYPAGTDGLFGSDLARYGYVLAEQMVFNTAHGSFKGGVAEHGGLNNDSDAIFVEGNEVTFFQSGIDFPAEAD